jgi:hypothetical protein
LQTVTRSSPRVLLALTCTVLCTALLAACGGSGDGDGAGKTAKPASAQAALEKTFESSTTSVDRARVTADVRLDPKGLLELGGPIAVRVTGPFAAPSSSAPARFDLAFRATLGGQKFSGAVISTGAKRFLKLDDSTYTLGAQKQAGGTAGGPHPGLKSLGIDPLRWITKPRDRGSERVAGVDTRRIAGDVDARRLLADVGTLLDKAGGANGSFLSPGLLRQIGDAVKSARVDVWTGADDSILRQIAVVATFAFKSAQSPIVGLDGGRLSFRVRLDDVNGAPLRIATPPSPRPLSEVTGEGGLRAVLAGIGAGLTGGIGGGAIELVGCVTKAGGSSVDLVRCVSKLGP